MIQYKTMMLLVATETIVEYRMTLLGAVYWPGNHA